MVQSADPMPSEPRRVTWRSVLLGLLGVVFICALTPYNNYVLLNTDFVGNHLPASLLVFFLIFVLLVNGMLRRFAPRRAMGSGELAVALGMTLVACSLPSCGLMRYLPGHLVTMFSEASRNSEAAQLLRQLDLPDWLWPTFVQHDPAARGSEAVVADFVGRTTVTSDTFYNRFVAVPWALWIRPTVSWGIFVLSLVGTVLSLSLVLRRQWTDNEKLAFPLASIYTSLIEDPPPGRALNQLLSSRLFWIAFGLVFCVHGFNGLRVYFPQYWPSIPLGYDLRSMVADTPWRVTAFMFRTNRVLFTIVGIMYFVQGRVAFSLWFSYFMMQVVRVFYGMQQSELTGGMVDDQMTGSLVAMGAGTLWLARRHLADVVRQMFRMGKDAPRGRYLPEGVAGWIFVLSVSAMLGWLLAAGASLVGAIVIVGLLLLIWIVLSKVVAETGLLYVLLPASADRLWLYMSDVTGGSARTTLKSLFFSNWFFSMFQHDTREALPVFATHALRVADEEAYDGVRHWRQGLPFLGALVLALVVAFGVSGASSLYIHYSYSTTSDTTQELVGEWGSFGSPREFTLGNTLDYVPPRNGPAEVHHRLAYFTTGVAITGILSVLNLRSAAWPLHPVGYLLANTWGMTQIWFSVFIGWLCKSLVLRVGGSQMLRASRPLFIGLIFGEAAALSVWLCINLVLNWLGFPYHAVHILPS